MIHQREQIVRKRGEGEMPAIAKGLCLAMAPAIEREQSEPGRWSEQTNRLVYVAAKPVLEKEWSSGTTFPEVKVQTTVDEKGHEFLFFEPANHAD